MRVYEYTGDRRKYMPLLLLADEQESMVEKYISRGRMFILDERGIAAAECLVTDEGDGVIEIKSIAVDAAFQRQGFGSALLRHVELFYKGKARALLVGTGDSPMTISFYEKNGFLRHHVVKDFFIDNYDHPIVECGRRLIDMIYLIKPLKKTDAAHPAEVQTT